MTSTNVKLRLIVFDMAGTTVDDVIDGTPLVLKSYDDAFRAFGITVPLDVLNDQRGRDKRTVIEELGGERADKIYRFFVDRLLENVGRIREMDGVSALFSHLHKAGVKVAASTGFPYEVSKAIVSRLGWMEKGLVDHWTCSEVVGKSRPNPAMIHLTMRRLHVQDPSRVMKVDDTVKGLEAGLRAGVVTVGVLTGTQSREKLRSADPSTIIGSIRELQAYLEAMSYT